MTIDGHNNSPRERRAGAALIIVLAFVVLLTGLIIAFFSRSITDRQISNSSASHAKVSAFANGAADTIIGDLKQEIVLSSSPTAIGAPVVTGTIYTPLSPASMLPQATGNNLPVNLLKFSNPGLPFYSGTTVSGASGSIPMNAIAVSSTAPSLNGRYVSPARWNEHFLLPLQTGTNDSTPLMTGGNPFTPPSWVLVARDGSNPTVWNNNMIASTSSLSSVVGRYAFAVYHEGGLLDVNAAGYPSTTGTLSAYKNGLPYADLTQVFLAAGIPAATATNCVDQLVAWRNYASIPAPNPFPSPGFTSVSASNYYNYVTSNTTGYLNISGTALNNNQTDRMFTSRQDLIKFVEGVMGFTPNTSNTYLNVLNYLTTFSRDLNQPSLNPAPNRPMIQPGTGGNNAYTGDTQINPPLLSERVTSSFNRNDGSVAQVGDPLVNKRFALDRLAWITYLGPSALNMGNQAVQASISGLGGNPADPNDPVYQFVAKGTAANVYKYFGLSWVPDPNNSGSFEWVYSHQGTAPVTSAGGVQKAAIQILGNVASLDREPDFFELLKAGLCVGSLGKTYSTTAGAASGSPGYYQANRDQSVDTQVIQTGANIVNQFAADDYPTRILFNLTGSLQEARGVTDLPYLYNVRQANIMLQDSNPSINSNPQVSGSGSLKSPGQGVIVQEPAIWNPHAINLSGSTTSLHPTSFKIVAVSTDPNGNPTGGMSFTPGWRSYITTGGDDGKGNYYAPTTSIFSLNAQNSELDFQIPGGDEYLFREPTLMVKPNVPTGSSLQAGVSSLINSFGPGYLKSVYQASQYTNNGVADNQEYLGFIVSGTTPLPVSWFTSSLSAGAISSGVPASNSSGIVPSEFFTVVADGAITYRIQYQDPIDKNNYLTYDEKFAPFDLSNEVNTWNNSSSGYGRAYGTNVVIGTQFQETCFDPRTSRWGMMPAGPGGRGNGAQDMPVMSRAYGNPYSSAFLAGWASPVGTTGNNPNSASQNAIWTNRPDEFQGMPFSTYNGLNLGYTFDTGPLAVGWYPNPPKSATNNPGYTSAVIRPGLYTQNNPGVSVSSGTTRFADDNQSPGAPGLSCYADADGVIRRGMSAYVLPTSLTPAAMTATGGASGLPLKTAYSFNSTGRITANAEAVSRPIMLNRPFRSVAELGYAFSDTPWRNLDFSTPESGAAGLLDLFCINDTDTANPIVAGKVNLNTQQAPVLQAILAGAYKDDFAIPSTTLPGNGGAATADKIATALVNRTSPSGANPSLLTNLSDLVGKWSSAQTVPGATAPFNIDGGQSYVGFSGTAAQSTFTPAQTPTELSSVLAADQSSAAGYTTMTVDRYREATIRALSSAGQTRVWNLLIDLVAQTGRYPLTTNGNMAGFVVEGEQHCWIHVAIDRFTGQVLDKQIEIVKQ